MAKPQIENGYTKIANELLDNLAQITLSANEWQVLLCIIRKTYGFQKKIDKIASTQITEYTGLDKYVVSKVLGKLSDKNIIIKQGKKLGVQKDWELWKLSKQTTYEANILDEKQEHEQKLSKQTTLEKTEKLSKQTTKVVQTDNKKLSKQTTTKEKKEILKENIYMSITDLFHELCPSLPKIRGMTNGRKDRLRVIRDRDGNFIDTLRELFTKTEASDFLTGRIQRTEGHQNWACNYDWIIQEKNMVKILEGVYDNRERVRIVKKPKRYTGR